MKKFLLLLTLAVTFSNVALGIAYACKCTSSGGSTCCGSVCSTFSDGSCLCTGSCPKSFAEEEEVLVN
jgi:hypothetical protein